jgi:hypothetical protein
VLPENFAVAPLLLAPLRALWRLLQLALHF